MDEKLALAETPASKPLDTFIVHDVASLLDHTSLLRPGLVFVSTPFEIATRAESDALRESRNIRTIINTLVMPGGHRYVNDSASSSKKREEYAVEDVLGLSFCRVCLRNEAFVKNVLNEMPFWSGL